MKAGRPDANSLWLLPSGPDQVGESTVRPTFESAYGEKLRAFQRLKAKRSTTLHILACRGDTNRQIIERFVEKYLTAKPTCSRCMRSKVQHVLFHFRCRIEPVEVRGVDYDVASRTRHLAFARALERLAISLADVEQAVTFICREVMDRFAVRRYEPDSDHDN